LYNEVIRYNNGLLMKKMDFSTILILVSLKEMKKMRTQTYYNTASLIEANVSDDINPLMINCAGAVSGSGIDTKSARRDFYVMYMLKGEMAVKLDGAEHTICSGQLLIIRPSTRYEYHSFFEKEISYIWVHFTGREAQNVLEKFKIETGKMLDIGICSGMVENWRRLFCEFMINDEFVCVTSAALLNQILAEASRRLSNRNRKTEIAKSIMFIHDNYNTDIKISELADMEGLSESHYRVRFKQTFGTSPGSYIIDRRINAAVTMLENTNNPVYEISAAVGYDDAYYFERVFKARKGVPPGRYRKSSR